MARAAALSPASLPSLAPEKALTQYVLNIWQTEQGMPQNSAQAIAQTPDGYLWLGTDEGLVRFDGARFVVFDSSNTPELGSNLIRRLMVDRQGRLWIGGGFGTWAVFEKGRFQRIPMDGDAPTVETRSSLEDSHGQLWVGTRGAGVFRLQEGRLRPMPWNAQLPGQRIEGLVEDVDGSLLVGSDAGLVRVRAGIVQAVPGLEQIKITALLRDRDDAIWVGTAVGLYRLQGAQLQHYGSAEGLSHDVVQALLQDRAGSLWIGTRGGGLDRWAHGRFDRLSVAQGLSNDIVTALLEDREGSLWIGTLGGGLNRLRDGPFTAISTTEGLSSNFVRAFNEAADGSLWIATDGGGLNRWADGVISHYDSSSEYSNLFTLTPRRAGGLWLGSRGGGLSLLSADSTRVQPSPHRDIQAVMTLLETSPETLWVGTLGGGLVRVQGDTLTRYTAEQGLGDNAVYGLAADPDGSIWVGTAAAGLARLAPDGSLRRYTVDDGLAANFVKSFYRDREGVLWIGTQGGGLARLRAGKLASLTTRQGLFDDTVHAVLEDDLGNLWMSSNKGVSRISKREAHAVLDGRQARLKPRVFGIADGMRTAECNTGFPAGLRTRDGRLWFATARGAVVVDPAQTRDNPVPPPVLVEDLVLEGRPLPLSAGLQLPPDVHSLEIHYTALSLLVPERVRFRYKLEGFDPDWVDPGTRRTAFYTNVPQGQYRFRVMASNNDGVWNEQGATLEFEVPPHWYQTWWLRSAAALLAIGLVYLMFRLRLAQMRARGVRLEAMVAERTAELRQANEELVEAQQQLVTQEKMASLGTLTAGVAHEINNPTNFADVAVQNLQIEHESLHAFIRELAGDDAGPEVISAFDQRFARLDEMAATAREGHERIKRIVADLRQFTRLDEAERKRIHIAEPIQSTVNLIRTRFDRVAFELDLAVNPEIECQPAKLGQVFMNLIVNACEATQGSGQPGQVRIATAQTDREVAIHVEDNGHGMSEATRLRVFEPFFTTKEVGKGTGLGLAVSLGIVREHGGSIDVDSAPGQGCRFRVMLPVASAESRSRG